MYYYAKFCRSMLTQTAQMYKHGYQFDLLNIYSARVVLQSPGLLWPASLEGGIKQ